MSFVKKETMERLREMSRTPDRAPMRRSVMMPTTGGKLFELQGDLEATRSALREALAIIDLMEAEDRG